MKIAIKTIAKAFLIFDTLETLSNGSGCLAVDINRRRRAIGYAPIIIKNKIDNPVNTTLILLLTIELAI